MISNLSGFDSALLGIRSYSIAIRHVSYHSENHLYWGQILNMEEHSYQVQKPKCNKMHSVSKTCSVYDPEKIERS